MKCKSGELEVGSRCVMRRFAIHYTAFKGTNYQQSSADVPVIEARDMKSAINKFGKRPYNRISDIRMVEEV
jgi:hypothetical protein